jgi:F420-0:gamma-glutamyl ligase-like protein
MSYTKQITISDTVFSLKANPGKNLAINYAQQVFRRFPVKSPVILPKTNLLDVIAEVVAPNVKEGDVLAISESVLAIAQDRAFKIKEIEPSWLARSLAKKVHKSKVGIGLGMPETMELAIRECGRLRILAAAVVAALTKPLGFKGMFYRVAGAKARCIDGPCSYTLPPFNEYATLGPENPSAFCNQVEKRLGIKTCVVDANDLGVNVLGVSKGAKAYRLKLPEILSDNPFGQSDEQTPFVLIRGTRKK